MFIQDSRRSYRTYTYYTEHILVLQILYGAYSRISDIEVPVGTIDTRVPVGTIDTRVPVGTTGLILNLPILEYPSVLLSLYRYRTYHIQEYP